MSSPLDSNFSTGLNSCTSRKLELCTLRFATIFHKEGNWFKSSLKSKFKLKRGEEKCQKAQ